MDSSLIGLFCPWNSPGRNTGVGSHFLLQGIFPIQSLNLALPHCRQTRYLLLLLLSCFSRVRLCATHRWQPTRLPVPGILQARTLEWGAIAFSTSQNSHHLKSLQITNAGEDEEKWEPTYTAGGNVSWCSHYGKQHEESSKKPKTELPIWSSNRTPGHII